MTRKGFFATNLPFNMAAFPDLIASDAILAMTSGRASNMMRRTPIGDDFRSRIKPSSNRVRRSTFPTTQIEISLRLGKLLIMYNRYYTLHTRIFEFSHIQNPL